jgi:hypothetical protein
MGAHVSTAKPVDAGLEKDGVSQLKKDVPSPSRRTRFTENVLRERDEEASTKPSLLAAVVRSFRDQTESLPTLEND